MVLVQSVGQSAARISPFIASSSAAKPGENQSIGFGQDVFHTNALTASDSRLKSTTSLIGSPLRFGQNVEIHKEDGVTFLNKTHVQYKVWAPSAQKVEIVFYRKPTLGEKILMKDYYRAKQRLNSLNALLKAAQDEKANTDDFFKRTDGTQDPQVQYQRQMIGKRNTYAWGILLGSVPDPRPQYKAEVDRLEPLFQKMMQDRQGDVIPMEADSSQAGYFAKVLPRKSYGQGARYQYRLHYKDSTKVQDLPDPYGEDLPEGVHGPSRAWNLKAFDWNPKGEAFRNTPKDLRDLSIYRMHIGTVTHKGDWEAATRYLEYIKRLGCTAVEVMPPMASPGNDSGYNLISLFATKKEYGTPRAFQRFVDKAHQLGIAVLVDIVLNHLGPEGNYLKSFDHRYTRDYRTGWGDALNMEHEAAREYYRRGMRHWVDNYHVDGYREDHVSTIVQNMGASGIIRATHNELLNEANAGLDANTKLTRLILTAEDNRNENYVTKKTKPNDTSWGGLGFHLQWIVGTYHALRSWATGKSHMGGSTRLEDLLDVLERGFFMRTEFRNAHKQTGEMMAESHDEMMNHTGARLAKLIGNVSKTRMAAVLYTLLPEVPLIFMGTEYGETKPFMYFTGTTDYDALLGNYKGRYQNPQPGLPISKKRFKVSKLTPIARRDTYFFTAMQRILQLRQSVPALWQGDRHRDSDKNDEAPKERLLFLPASEPRDAEGWEYYQKYKDYLNSGVIAIHRKGYEEKAATHNAFQLPNHDKDIDFQDEVFILANTQKTDYGPTGPYNMVFPPGTWQEIYNTRHYEPNEPQLDNETEVAEGKQNINLPGYGVVIFRKVHPEWAGPKAAFAIPKQTDLEGDLTRIFSDRQPKPATLESTAPGKPVPA